MTLFDKQIQLRMRQANVNRWVPDFLPLLADEDVPGADDFATRRLPLVQAPEAYEMFQKKADGASRSSCGRGRTRGGLTYGPGGRPEPFSPPGVTS